MIKTDVYAFETDTVWGLGADINSEYAIKKIYELKHRESTKPLILMSYSLSAILQYIQPLNTEIKEVADKYLPGALTIIVKKNENFPKYLNPEFDTVGIRIPDHSGFQDFCRENNLVLATTSANLSNETPCKNSKEVEEKFSSHVEIIKNTILGKNSETPSTVILAQDKGFKVLREGNKKF